MEKNLGDFLLELDGKDYNDKTLLDMLATYPDEIHRKSRKPVAFEIAKMKGMTYEGGIWAEQEYTELLIYAEINGKFKRYFYSSKPIFMVDGGVSYTQELDSKDKSTMVFQKKFMRNVIASYWPIAKGVYGNGGEDEKLINYFVDLWRRTA